MMHISTEELRAAQEEEGGGFRLLDARRMLFHRKMKRRIEVANSERAFKDILIDLLDEVVLK